MELEIFEIWMSISHLILLISHLIFDHLGSCSGNGPNWNMQWRKIRNTKGDVNPTKNNETQQRKGTQDRSMDRFEGMTSTRCL
jgi:hypothetical protein